MEESKRLAHVWHVTPRTADVKLSTLAPFRQMILNDGLIKGLHKAGYKQPTVVQAAAIPIGKAGIDLLVQSKSGTGKTLIFCSIILEDYNSNIKEPQSLIIAPTREIAVQTAEVINTIGSCMNGFRAVCVIGGLSVVDDRKHLQGAKCIVGTPGRVLHLIDNNVLNTSKIRILVLDEADKLYNNSFRHDLERLQKALTARVQTIACSATFCNNLDKELSKTMLQPVLVSTEKGTALTGLLGIKQFVYELHDETKKLNMSIFEMLAKRDALNYIFSCFEFKQCILFARTQSRADSYCNYLKKDGWPCEYISGGQSQKTRLEIFRKFRDFKYRILVTTDLMARGIDSEHVNLVINLEVPQDMVTYLHRIGRAGRFGSHGIAITFLATDNDKPLFNNLLNEMASDVRIMKFPPKNSTAHEALCKYKDKQIDFWDFSCPDKEAEFYGLYNGYKEEQTIAPLASQDVSLSGTNTITETTTATTSEQSSIDTTTFHIDSKDSAINGPIVIRINDDGDNNNGNAELSHMPLPSKQQQEQQLTQTNSQNGSSQYLVSSNTIDDASSIAADSLRSSNQSIAMQKTIKSNNLQILIDQDDDNNDSDSKNSNQVSNQIRKNQQIDVEENQKAPALIDHFDNYANEILNGNNNYSTAARTESSSITDDPSLSSQKLAKLKLLLIDKSTENDEEKKSLTSLSSKLSSLSTESIKDLYDDFDNYKVEEEEELTENSNNNNNDNDGNDDDNDDNDDKSSSNEIDGNTFVLSVTTPSVEPQESLSKIIGETSRTTTITTNGTTITTTVTSSSVSSSKDFDVKHFPSPISKASNVQHLRNLSISKTAQVEILPCDLSPEESVLLVNAIETESSSSQTWPNDDLDSDTKSSGFDEAMISNGNPLNDNDDDNNNDDLSDDGNAADSELSNILEVITNDALRQLNINENALETDDDATEQSIASDDDDDDDNEDVKSSLMSYPNLWQNGHFFQNMNESKNDNNDGDNVPTAGVRQTAMIKANQSAYDSWINLYWNQINLVQNYVRIYTHVNQQQQQQ